MKVCRGCKEAKELSFFRLRARGRNGINARCRGCETKSDAARYRRNALKVKAVKKIWRAENRLRMQRLKRAWIDKNPGKVRAQKAQRRADQMRATPSWVDKDDLKFVYDMAALFSVEVDHIVPLKGKYVCGLHVPWNLQLLPKLENLRKGNKFTHETNWI